MNIDFNYPHNLLQYKEYIVAEEGQKDFFFNFKEVDEEMHYVRVFKNDLILNNDEFESLIITGDGVKISLKINCKSDDRIHLDIFLPLVRNNEYSICISHDFELEITPGINIYPFMFDDYSNITCKLQVMHSRIGFIPKSNYIIENETIRFVNIDILEGDRIYIKIIQDGGILLQ